MTRFIDLRYPHPAGGPSLGDRHWTRIQDLFNVILNRMPKHLQQQFDAIDPTRKGGRILMSRPKSDWERTRERAE